MFLFRAGDDSRLFPRGCPKQLLLNPAKSYLINYISAIWQRLLHLFPLLEIVWSSAGELKQGQSILATTSINSTIKTLRRHQFKSRCQYANQ
uniref:Uncharacterized protein n=1 Tax=Anguilla anguilla TaxID=7936 RepID=A0A0E9QKG1_ANGAN